NSIVGARRMTSLFLSNAEEVSMPATYNILLMGASYGSLLASKLLFGGHQVKLVCLPAEADLIDAEGFRVRLPGKVPHAPVEVHSPKAPRNVPASRTRRCRTDRVRPHLPRHAGAAISLARRAPIARRRRTIQGALHVDHEHAAAALSQAHPR